MSNEQHPPASLAPPPPSSDLRHNAESEVQQNEDEQDLPSLPQSPDNSSDFRGFQEWEIAADADTVKKISVLARQRSEVHRKLLRLHSTFRQGKSFGVAQLNMMTKKLATAYSEFTNVHNQILCLVPDESVPEQRRTSDAFEDLHDYLSAAVEDLILRTKTVNIPPPAAPQVIIQQQPLKAPIPTFDGSYESWPKFKAVFQDLMANSTDTNAIKLYHLDKALVGAASGVLDESIISQGDYGQAWAVLAERYENMRVIVESHIRGLLNLKKMTAESHKELRRLLDESTRHVESLRFLKQELSGVSEHIIVYVITNALDKSTRKAWESTQKRGELPRYNATIAFLKNRCQILENCEPVTPTATVSTQQANKQKIIVPPLKFPAQKSYTATTSPAGLAESCEFCSGAHLNFQCPTMKNIPVSQKLEKVRAANVCFNCLRKGHRCGNCPSNNTCRKCQRRHHTILHEDNAEESSHNGKPITMCSMPECQSEDNAVQEPTQDVSDMPVSTTCSFSCHQSTKNVLLLTAVVHVIDRKDQHHDCRVLLDSGSQVNFVTEEMANILGFPKQPANVPITGINALKTLAREKMFVKLRSKHGSFFANIECLITPKVTGAIPTAKLDITRLPIPDHIELADPTFHIPGKIDLLVGAELFLDLLKPGHLVIAENMPQLRDTHLGWVVAGTINIPHSSEEPVQHSNLASINVVENMIRKFWEIEEVPNVSPLSAEEQSCEDHFRSTTRRDENGRFVVNLPLKDNCDEVDDCRALALKRFLMLEKRLTRDPELRMQYVDFVRDYEALGHCHEVQEADDTPNQTVHYMPHHAVLRPSSSSTKCRVVFDASAKSSSKPSLNDVLRIGPTVQRDLFSIMLGFRCHVIAFSADITKMYRQILVAPKDTCYQRIFWREQPSDRLRVLELKTVTYGTASAPFQATRCLVQLAEDESTNFSIGSRIVKEDCYVDDVLSGANTVEEAIKCQYELKAVLAGGCFPIHKWCSNSPEFLETIPPEEREGHLTLQEYGANEAIKVLGLLWDPSSDQLLIAHHHNSTQDEPPTKRAIYSQIARLFDPLGLFSPFIVIGKLLMQQLWKTNTGWDEVVNERLQQQWCSFKRALPQLNLIQVPRCIQSPEAVAFELHGFADSSTVAYGACLYIRSVFSDGSATVCLLTSKSKVAPLHELSIPRKELCAALLLARLLDKVCPALPMTFQNIVLWSDSTIVLAWMKKPLDRLHIFVRNRVAEIHDRTREYKWCYVRSEYNPADVVSRGQLPDELKCNSLWWNGPAFLSTTSYEVDEPEEVPEESLPEMKDVIVMSAIQYEPFPLFSKYNNFRKIQRVIAYVLRFVSNCRKKTPSERITSVQLTIAELQLSTLAIFKTVQQVHLMDEIQRLRSNKPCKIIGSLRPFIEDGLLRVGGRLANSKLPYASKHPIILPHQDHVVKMFLRTMHVELLHPGQAALINFIRQRYWLLNARSTVRQVTRKCVKCFRVNPQASAQLMGNLPRARIVPSPPFAVTGVDYAGPFLVRQGTYRPKLVKAYVAVYVCMTTKAIHLEIVSDLTSDAFLASLRRFISRRGLVQQLHSDNATNFKGANHEMHRLYCLFKDQQALDQLHQYCEPREIEWHFIPPDAPEFGGLWEAAVKSAKLHLKRILGNAKLTFEEFATLLTEIEAVLNSRPLFSISTDPEDVQVITPAHYLIGRPLTAPAEPSLETIKVSRLSRWQHLQLMREQFWRTWSKDYLNSLQPRKKNRRMMPNLRSGMIVLVHDKTLPPLKWKMGRISAVYPDEEGLVRVVDVFVDGSTFRRPISKLSVLPIEDNDCGDSDELVATS